MGIAGCRNDQIKSHFTRVLARRWFHLSRRWGISGLLTCIAPFFAGSPDRSSLAAILPGCGSFASSVCLRRPWCLQADPVRAGRSDIRRVIPNRGAQSTDRADVPEGSCRCAAVQLADRCPRGGGCGTSAVDHPLFCCRLQHGRLIFCASGRPCVRPSSGGQGLWSSDAQP